MFFKRGLCIFVSLFFFKFQKMKKSFLFKLSLIFWFSIQLLACNNDEQLAQPLVFISPTDINIEADVDDVLSFRVITESDIRLTNFLVKIKPDNDFERTELDSAVNIKNLDFNYEYKIPVSASGQSLIFTFLAIDEEGNSGRALRRVIVSGDTIVNLTETSGHKMYSSNSNNADAYNLESNSPEFSNLADSLDRDIQDATDTSQNLSFTWISPAGGKLVRFNNFDYANANTVSLKNAYLAGTKLDKLENLSIDDIILTKLSNTTNEKYVAIKITDIQDAQGTENDAYTFNIKK